jgi:hypothetical protein
VKRSALGLLPLLAWGLAAPGWAQTAEEDSVSRRPRPDYDAQGVAWPDLLDGFSRLVSPEARQQPRDDASSDILLFPTLQTALIADSNALRRQSGGQGDFALQLGAGLAASGGDEDAGWSLGASGDSVRYLRFSSQNGDQARLHQGGFLAPTEEWRADLSFDEQWLVEPIQDSGTGYRQQRPNRYGQYSTKLTLGYTSDDWQLLADQQAVLYRYAGNPPVILGNELDREELTSTLHLARTIFEGTALFIEPQVNLRHYDREISTDGLRHDSAGVQVLGGLRYDLSSVTYVEAGAGWLRQDYDDHAFAAVSGPALQARAVWNPLDRLSFGAGATRRIAESNLQGTAGAEVTAETASADYEIDDNLLAGFNFSFTDMRYKAELGSVSRTDDITQYGVELRYLIDETASIAAAWTDYRRASTLAGAVLDFNRLTVSALLQW